MQREYKISLSQEYYSDVVYLSQYDDDYDVIFHVINKYSAADVGGKSAKFTGTRTDGLGFTFNAVAVGSSVSFHINTSLTACAGTHTAEIIFYSNDGLYFGSANVQVIVEKAAHPEGTIDADEEALRELAEQVQEIVDTAAAEVKGEAESWAVGERDGEPVPSTDPTYHNNAKYYAEQAQDIANSIGIDATLSISGKAADAKKTGDEISSLKEDLSQVSDTIGSYFALTNWVSPAYINTNVSVGAVVNTTPVSMNAYSYMIISVKKGDKFLVSGQGGNASRLWAFVDENYALLSKTSITDAQQSDVELTAEANGYLILNTYTGSSVTYAVYKYSTIFLDAGFVDISRLLKPFGYIATNINAGMTVNIIPTYDSSTCCGVIAVKKGDILKVSGHGGNASRLWAFVDENYALISVSSTYLVASNLVLTAPDDGYCIYNSTNVSANTYAPKIEKYAVTLEEADNLIFDNVKYTALNNGNDVLTAFSNITCCGDSLTASVVYTGYDDETYITRSAYKKYPQILGDKIGAEWESLATGGYSASDWWNAYNDRIVQKTNQLVIVYLGTNGALTDTLDTDAVGDDYTNYANTDTGNYCKIVAKALDVGAKVLLIKPYIGTDIYTTRAVIDKIAEKFSVAVVDVPYLAERCYHLYPDGSGLNTTHYNDLGYAAFTDSLIKNVGALPNAILARLIPA